MAELIFDTESTTTEKKEISMDATKEMELTDAEKAQVAAFVEKIDITNSAGVISYGVDTQKKLADFSEKAMSSVKTKDIGKVGDMLSDLVVQLKDLGADEGEHGLKALFKKGANKAEKIKAKYASVESNIDKISDELQKHQDELVRDIENFDKMYELNLAYYKELSMYIIAGKERIETERNTTLAELQRKAEESKMPEDAERAKDFADKCDRFEKKLYDLELTRTIALQTGPQIRMIQSSDTVMAEKIQSTILNTIPLWKNQMVIAIGTDHALKAAASERAVNDATNTLLRKNADSLKTATISSAKEAERGIVDIETLKHTNETLISTFDEVIKIEQEGKEQRKQAEEELKNIESQLKDKLLETARKV